MAQLTLTVSPEERAAGRLKAENYRTAALLLHTAGYVVLRDLLPPELVTRINSEFERVFEDCVQSKIGDSWYQVSPHKKAVFWERAARWRIFPKLRPPFDDVSLLANPLITPLFEELLGDDFICKFVSSDTCLRGSFTQAPHRELSAGGATIPCAYIINVPLTMCGLENGPLEVWPLGTHLWQPNFLKRHQLSDDTQDGENSSMEQFAKMFPSQKLVLEPGSILIRDPGMLHRGTPNPTDIPRTMLTICYVRRGHEHDYGDVHFNVDDAIYENLAPAAKRVFDLPARAPKTQTSVEHPVRLRLWPWGKRKP